MQAAAEMYATNVDLAAGFLGSRLLEREHALSSLLGVVSEPYVPEHARFVGRLSIPYLTPNGAVNLRFRCLACPEKCVGHGKYDSPAGLGTNLYNVTALHEHTTRVGCTEGELDALVATHVLGLPSVGVPGIKNWKPHFGRCFADFDEVLVFADADEDEEKGIKHAKRAVKEIGEGRARLVLPPAGLDLTEHVQRDGVEAVRDACGV